MNQEVQFQKEKKSAFGSLSRHLDELGQDPTKPQDADLFTTIKYVLHQRLGDTIPVGERVHYIQQIYHLLPNLPNPSGELLALLDSLLTFVPVYRMLDIEPPIDFAAGLSPEAGPYNNLTLSLLQNVDEKSAQRLATHARAMFEALVKLWLTTEDMGISSKASAVLLKLIQTGQEAGQKRFFRDSDVYGLVYDICYSNGKVPLDRNARSIAQSRLLDFIADLTRWDWTIAVNSHDPEIESRFGLKSGEGLLDFATRYAADFDADVLLHRNLIQILACLLEIQKSKYWTSAVSPAFEFLQSRGLHQKTMRIFLNPDDPGLDPTDVSLLYTESASYARTFVSTHPNLVLGNEQVRSPVLNRLQKSFSTANWSNPTVQMIQDLAVFSVLPRSCLNVDMPSLVSLIPYNRPYPGAIGSLLQIFHGPEDEEIQVPPPGDNAQKLNQAMERQLAHTLFDKFLVHNHDLFTTLTASANKLAFPAVCLVSIRFIHALVDCKWDDALGGTKAIMNDSRSRNAVVTFLLGLPSRPQTSDGGQDVALQSIAEARFDLTKNFVDKLAELGEWQQIEEALRKRVQTGIWGRPANVTATLGRD